MAFRGTRSGISRRTLLVGGGAGVGLVLAWALWPRRYEPSLAAGPGETLFNAFLKIGRDGRVIVAVPQAEVGQGVYTSLPQILADELGADWRTVSVEPAPVSPLYANQLLAEEAAKGELPSAFQGIGNWAAREYATRTALMLTGGSSSVRAFEPRLREAGAGARVLLEMAAADRWNVGWETLDTAGGFVVNGRERLSFADLAEAAAEHDLPDTLPMRGGLRNRLTGQALPRLDLPAKVDGSAVFGADVRLPDMVYASVRQGPIGGGRLTRVEKAAGDRVPGVVRLFETERWAGAAATNWWAANRAVEAMNPLFEVKGELVGSASIDARMKQALQQGKASRFLAVGDPDELLGGSDVVEAEYGAGPAPSAALETLTATARYVGEDRLEIWVPTQAAGLARAAAARAAGFGESQVTVYPTLVGSGYGRKLETAAIAQAVHMAAELKRPVQLVWPRVEETIHDGFRPPARAKLAARLQAGGRIVGWQARIAAAAAVPETVARLGGDERPEPAAHASAVDGAAPPYAIPAVAVDHVPLDTGLPAGIWRSGAHSYTAFFTECFVDELARKSGIEPLSFRMQMLGSNPRLARVLTTATTLGGWDGGMPGSRMGIAAHSCFGSHVAILVEAEVGPNQRVRVSRAVCAVDVGRVVNPEIVRQLIEGGIIYGIAGAIGLPLAFERSVPLQRSLGALGLPLLRDTPEITVDILESEEDPGGVTELGVPAVAPAIANAVFASTGQRLRSLPLVMGST
jgi:isoquinoline 1-oxidoreductase beta subunit